MQSTSQPQVLASVAMLRAAVAASPIVLPTRSLAARLADWETTRKSADVDEVVLAWLASCGRGVQRRLDA
jgi:hypothetical protein